MNLSHKKCTPCEGGTQPLSREKVIELLPELSLAWEIDDTATQIHIELTFRTFVQAIEFVRQIAELAEEEGHHPDLFISYNHITITLTTHAIKGLSENDFIMASKIENTLSNYIYEAHPLS